MNNELSDFYKGKRVLITGNTGFKGSWLGLMLYHLGATIIGYSKKGNPNNTFSNDTIQYTGLIQEYGDITHKSSLEKIITSQKPDIIFHLAAQPLVSESYKNPFDTLETNVSGTLCLLEVLRNYNEKCNLVVVTSDKCYKVNKQKNEYKEEDELGGFDPYSLSKAFQEQLVKTYYDNYYSKEHSSIKCCTIRSGNVIGGGDFSKSRLIPDIVTSMVLNEKIVLRNPSFIRPWIYILDSLHAYLLAGKALENAQISGESFNVGPNKDELLNVSEIVKLFVDAYSVKDKIMIEHEKTEQYKESEYLFLSTEKIKHVLQWNPKYSIAQSVKNTANWYKVYNLNEQNIISFSLKEINEYFS